MRVDCHANRKAVLARRFGAFGAIAFGVAAVVGLFPIWYRVPQGCDTCEDPSTGEELVHWAYTAFGYLAVGLCVFAAWRSYRCAQGRGGGWGALGSGAASLVLYSLWFVVWSVWDISA